MTRPRPDWPGGREPVNGGLLYITVIAVLVCAALGLAGCWGLWFLAAIVEAL